MNAWGMLLANYMPRIPVIPHKGLGATLYIAESWRAICGHTDHRNVGNANSRLSISVCRAVTCLWL